MGGPARGPQPRIVAHRGAPRVAPENTLAAFRAAVAAGADGVELDVHLSRDGVPVVIHDERLERTTNGHGPVGAASAAELATLEAGAWFHPPLRGERVPTLQAVLALLAPTLLELHLELKTARMAYPGLVPAVHRLVREAGLLERTTLSSFNHRTLLEARALSPPPACAALLYEVLVEPWIYARQHDFQALHPHHATVDAALVQACHRAGLAVRAYTVDDPAEAQRLFAAGVDALITNDPAALLRLRDEPGT
jgi:glycerophosphoryl diester phosphodiesterase